MAKTKIRKLTRFGSGFTLLELLVVVGILAALVALALPYYQDYVNQSKLTAAQTDLQTFKKALAMYDQLEPMSYTTENDMTGLIGKYMQDFRSTTGQKLPIDPWGNDYHFDVAAGAIWSGGPDGIDNSVGSRIPSGDDLLTTWKPEFFLATARKVNATTLELIFSRKITSITLVKDNVSATADCNSIQKISDTVFRATFAAEPTSPVVITTDIVTAQDGRKLLHSFKKPDGSAANQATF